MEFLKIMQHDSKSGTFLGKLSAESQHQIRNELHAVQVGLNLLRREMLAGDLAAADLTYATIQHCFWRLMGDEDSLSATNATDREAS